MGCTLLEYLFATNLGHHPCDCINQPTFPIKQLEYRGQLIVSSVHGDVGDLQGMSHPADGVWEEILLFFRQVFEVAHRGHLMYYFIKAAVFARPSDLARL